MKFLISVATQMKIFVAFLIISEVKAAQDQWEKQLGRLSQSYHANRRASRLSRAKRRGSIGPTNGCAAIKSRKPLGSQFSEIEKNYIYIGAKYELKPQSNIKRRQSNLRVDTEPTFSGQPVVKRLVWDSEYWLIGEDNFMLSDGSPSKHFNWVKDTRSVQFNEDYFNRSIKKICISIAKDLGYKARSRTTTQIRHAIIKRWEAMHKAIGFDKRYNIIFSTSVIQKKIKLVQKGIELGKIKETQNPQAVHIKKRLRYIHGYASAFYNARIRGKKFKNEQALKDTELLLEKYARNADERIFLPENRKKN